MTRMPLTVLASSPFRGFVLRWPPPAPARSLNGRRFAQRAKRGQPLGRSGAVGAGRNDFFYAGKRMGKVAKWSGVC